MLSKQESWEYYLSLYPYFVRQEDTYLNLATRSKFAILMSNDRFGRIVALSQYYRSLEHIQREAMTFGILMEPPYTQSVEFHLNDCWRWQLVQVDHTNLEWQQVYDFKDTNELYQAILDIQKVAAIDFITSRIKRNSRSINRYLTYQQKIYFCKYIESIDILNNNITEDPDKKFPYVTGYAEVVGTDLQTAARNIKLQYETRASKEAEYENSRIKHIANIKNETKLENLKNLIAAFVAEREY